jgi:rhodanese-related sulfurtransferase
MDDVGMKKNLLFILYFIFALSAIFGGCAYITGEAIVLPETTRSMPSVRDMSPEEVRDMRMMNRVFYQFVDVRTPQEYAGGHIDNAINIDYQAPDFKEKINSLDKNGSYIVYCRTGARSAAASKVMVELGFQNIINMTGGYTDWVSAGLPVNQ